MTDQGTRGTAASDRTYPVMPLRNLVHFPEVIVPLAVGREGSVAAIDEAARADGLFVAVMQKDPEAEEPDFDGLHTIGTLTRILKLFRMNERSFSVISHGVSRVRIIPAGRDGKVLRARIEELQPVRRDSMRAEAMAKQGLSLFEKLASMSPNQNQEQVEAVMRLQEPSAVADGLAHQMEFPPEVKQALLQEPNVEKRLERILEHLTKETHVLELGSKIHSEVLSKMNKAQRDYYLREQLKAIRKELGEEEDAKVEVEDLRKRAAEAGMPEEAEKVCLREISRMERMHASSAEYSVAHTYVDWLLSMPWKAVTRDTLELRTARRILDRDHAGLRDVKQRLLEFLAVKSLKEDLKAPILCLVGPPGVGKTSLGRSVAQALGRKFVRISLGGVRDEAELRGHRRTYVGALPGRIIQGIRRAGTRNPLIMLDEIDKVGRDFRGDPSSVLLEVLDPEQNATFSDHYLEVEFDLSQVVFLANANVLDTIPGPLLDRMEVLRLPGYTLEEKVTIARRHLVPRILGENGLKPRDVTLSPAVLAELVNGWTREAGLRQLSRQLGRIARKVAVRHAEGKKGAVKIALAGLPAYLGPPRFSHEVRERVDRPGVATGLAWTPTGGDVLFIEAARMPGRGRLSTTGQLGEVMKESAIAAFSLLKSRSRRYGLKREDFEHHDVHVHVPAGAVPKDGPSAGIALGLALLSILRGVPLRSDVAMTGEITLRGKVLPIGGVKEKILAAKRARIREIIVPERNRGDVEEVEKSYRQGLRFHFVSDLDQAAAVAFRKEDLAELGFRKPSRSGKKRVKRGAKTTSAGRRAARA